MAPKIRQVQIRNYKSIGRAVVDLEPFTVLVGANGTGKSNFVDALAFVQECLSHSLDQALSRRGGVRVHSPWESEEPALTGLRLLIELSETQLADYSFEIGWSSRAPARVSHERCQLWQRGEKRTSFEVTEGRFLDEIPGIRPQISSDRLALFAASATDEFRPLYDFLKSIRLYSIDPSAVGLPQTVTAGESLDSRGSNAAAILQLLQQKEPDRYELICRLLARAVKGVQKVWSSVEDGRATLDFIQDIGYSGHFSGREMSDGTLRLLGLLLAVYQPQRPSLLAIEEPEATVHPAMAELVLQVLMDAAHDCQVLITTHSPDLLDAKELDDRQIRVVTKQQGRTSIAPLAQASREAIREHLFTAGELLRSNELGQDVQAAEESAQRLDLFGEIPASSVP
ncbi:MAG TPA: AAA family ATPase [Thermoanaerobaculia bacterium]|jgi:predicted ATPase|nr:AAA family ATPase [Thermoanaerobaculia bacterium]